MGVPEKKNGTKKSESKTCKGGEDSDEVRKTKRRKNEEVKVERQRVKKVCLKRSKKAERFHRNMDDLGMGGQLIVLIIYSSI